MLERVPTVLTGQETLDKAFQKAQKIDVPDPVRYHRIRKTEAARMQSVCDTIHNTLRRFPDAFPNLDNLRDYDKEILDIVAGLPRLRKALGSIKWAADKALDVYRDSTERMARERSVEGIKRQQKRCYGRVSSLVYEVDPDLDFIREVRERGKKLPSVDPGVATLVVAGYPNVGKSSLLAAWTKAKPEIASYSFTTKQAEVGHFLIQNGEDETKYQVIDTPGLLDRPDEERNEIERQAVAALRHAGDAVLFLVDPTGNCGWDVEQQEHLLADVKAKLPGLPFLVAESKCDLLKTASERLKFSTETGEGLAKLQAAILAILPTEEDLILDEDPLDRWRPERDARQAA